MTATTMMMMMMNNYYGGAPAKKLEIEMDVRREERRAEERGEGGRVFMARLTLKLRRLLSQFLFGSSQLITPRPPPAFLFWILIDRQ